MIHRKLPDRTKSQEEINPKQPMSLRSKCNDLANFELSSAFQNGLKMELYLLIDLIKQLVEFGASTSLQFGTCVIDEMKLVFLIEKFIIEL